MFRDGMKVLGVRRTEVEGRVTLLESPVPPTFVPVCARIVSVGGSVMPCRALKRQAAGTGKAH